MNILIDEQKLNNPYHSNPGPEHHMIDIIKVSVIRTAIIEILQTSANMVN